MLFELKKSLRSFCELENKKFAGEFKFPLSYRYLMANYGYGRYLGLFILYLPERNIPDSIHERGPFVKEKIEVAIEEEYLEYYPAGNADLARTLYPFGMGENGEYLTWQLDREVFEQTGEWPVWVVGPRMGGLTYGGKNVLDFFTKASTDEVKQVMGPGCTPLRPSFEGF